MNKLSIYKSKKSIIRKYFNQFAEIFGLEIGLLISAYFVEFNFIIFQLIVFTISIFIYFSKANKLVTRVSIDYINKEIELVIFWLFIHRIRNISFEDLHLKFRMKIILNFHTAVVEFYGNKRFIALIPLKNSLWNKQELEKLIDELRVLGSQFIDENQIQDKLTSNLS